MKVAANRHFRRWHRILGINRGLMRAWGGDGFRLVNLDYLRPEDILSGQGSFLHGGRWNAPGTCKSIYASTTKSVAVQEAEAAAKYYGFSSDQLRPRLQVAVHFELGRVVDLTDDRTLRALDVALEELRMEDWRKVQAGGHESMSQALGRAAFGAGAEGLLAPSSPVDGGANMVCFPENLGNGSDVTIWGEEELRKLRG